MEQFDLTDAVCKDSFAGRLILSVMTAVAGDKVFEVFKMRDNMPRPVDVEIRINGIEVPLSVFVNVWDRNRAWFAMKDVRELVRRRMGRVDDKISSVERGLDDIIREELPGEWRE